MTDRVQMSGLQNADFDFFRLSKNVSEGISDEDNISDDEGNQAQPLFQLRGKENSILSSSYCQAIKYDADECGSVNQDGKSTWSSVLEETKELMRVNENRSSSVCHSANHKDKKVWKGSRIKSKPKFSFGFRSEVSLPLATDKGETEFNEDVEGLEELKHGAKEHSMTELLEGLQKEQPESEQVQVKQYPIAELLEGLPQSHGQQIGTPKMIKETKVKRSTFTAKRNRSSSLAYSTLDNGDLIDASSDEEAEKFKLKVYDEDPQKSNKTLEISGWTMADKIQEVLNAASVNDQGMLLATSKHTGGYYGRLQQVIQTEKERHMEFLNQSRGRITRDEAIFLDVKIVSRYLDAKLIVCQCLLSQNASLSSQCVLNSQRYNNYIEVKRTVIFSSRICNNVDLEVGNVIRIHPPWKEVEATGKDGGIILCTYFSQISI